MGERTGEYRGQKNVSGYDAPVSDKRPPRPVPNSMQKRSESNRRNSKGR